MGEERDVLVKKVFPEIRRVCAERQIHFMEVDLRWGITAEEGAGGKVISLCLNEIDNCRPYLIGLLGERYGWSVHSTGGLPDRLLSQSFDHAAKQHRWITHYRDRSVTEIELLYGALFYPEYAPCSAFYFRDSNYANNQFGNDPQQLRIYAPEDDASAHKLRNLKARIRNSGLPVRENYHSQTELAELVLKDLLSFIERDFPLSQTDAQSTDHTLALDRQIHLSHCYRLAQVYVERPPDYTRIERYLDDTSVSSPLIITGDTGSGKSSLIAAFLAKRFLPKSNATVSNTKQLLIIHFAELTDSALHKVLWRLMEEIKEYFKLDTKLESEPEKLVTQFSSVLTEAGSRGKVVIMLDGLNHLDKRGQLATWLPVTLPSSVRIVISLPCANSSSSSSLPPSSAYSSGFDNREAMEAATHRDGVKNTEESQLLEKLLTRVPEWKQHVLTVSPLQDEEKRQLVEMYLSRYSKKLSPSDVCKLVESPLTALPIFLRTILEQLRIFGKFEELSNHIDFLLRSNDVAALFGKILSSWEQDYNAEPHPSLVQDTMSLLCVSQNGLLETEIVEALGISQRLIWSTFYNACQHSLVNKCGLLSLAHNHLRKAIIRRYLPTKNDEEYYHRLLCDYFAHSPLSVRKIHEYPFYLERLGGAHSMQDFLSNLQVFSSLYTDATKYELFSYWNTAGETAKAQAAATYLSLLRNNASSLSELEDARLSHKLAQFMQEVGQAAHGVPLAQRALSFFQNQCGPLSNEVADVFFTLATMQVDEAQTQLAKDAVGKALEIRRTRLGERNEDTMACVFLLAQIHKKEGDYPAAITLYQEAMNTLSTHLGSSHPSLAPYLQALADVYRKQARFEEATPLYTRCLDMFQDAFGYLHPKVAEILDCLGRIHKKKGKYSKAKQHYLDALRIVETIYGREHTKVAELSANLADVYRKLADLEEAKQLYKRAIGINQRLHGLMHPDLAENFNALALIYKLKGQLNKAETFVKQAIAIVESSFGLEHLKVAEFTNNLGDILSIRAKYDESKLAFEKCLRINIRCLGESHPEVSENLNALGMIEKKRGNYEAARDYYERSLQIIETVYGKEHPKVAIYVHNLGVIYRKTGDLESSWKCYFRAYTINTELFGPDNPVVAENLNGQGVVRKKQRELDEAADLHSKALAIFEQAYGPNHDKVALTLNYLAEVYRKQGKYTYDGAERLYQRALKINADMFGEEHPEVAENLNGLAQVLRHQMNYSKAEPLYQQAIRISELTLGQYHPHVVNRYRNLALLYEQWGRIDQAQRVQQKLTEIKKRGKFCSLKP
ncbi:DUF4062 domain-containing protein (Fragment), variant 2 [Balamuthia mandrillaris]